MPRGVDIIVPIYRNARLARACLASLVDNVGEIARYTPRIMLINDSPDDAEVCSLLQNPPVSPAPLFVLQNESNLGFVRSVNRCLCKALEERRHALVVNSDTRAFPGTLANLLHSAEADPQIGFASPRSNNASICSLPHLPYGSNQSPESAWDRWRQISQTMPPYHFAPTAVGFFMFISYSVLANHGGLSDEFGVGYEEENDLVMRAGKVGTRAIIVNNAFVYHEGAASFSLTELDLGELRHSNLLKLSKRHPEFLSLVRRYENAPHYQAERLLSGLIKEPDGRIRVAFDLTEMGRHYNGTNEQAVAVLRALAPICGQRIRLTAIATHESFLSHRLDEISGLQREDPSSVGLHAIAIRLGQPFEFQHLTRLASCAPINVFAMLDTIAEDCGPLADMAPALSELWDFVSEHATGLVFISNFSERTFCNRHPPAQGVRRWSALLPTRLSCYTSRGKRESAAHILVLGNHYAHKGVDLAAQTIAAAFPSLEIIALGGQAGQSGNLVMYRAGTLEPETMNRLFAEALVVVLPSYVEGFGFGLLHALAAGRPVVARRIPPTEEILSTFDDVHGVFLFDHDIDLLDACRSAMSCNASGARDVRASTWDDWAVRLADFCLSLPSTPDLFQRLLRRTTAIQRWRGPEGREYTHEVPPKPSSAKALNLETLLSLEARAFVEHAYATLLCRPVDESGLDTYLGQLKAGTPKLEILASLATSPEGRARGVQIPGLDEMISAARKPRRQPLLKRVFGT